MIIDGYKLKDVQGLYNYMHFERDDGAWFQVPLPFGRDKYLVFCAGPTSPIKRIGLEAGDQELRQWEAMMQVLPKRRR